MPAKTTYCRRLPRLRIVAAMELFDAAFPPSRARHRKALEALARRADAPVHYSFSFPVARWLAARCPGELCIDWDAFEDTSRLDELLERVLHPAEDDYFNSGWVDTRGWIDAARGDAADFDWLLAQLADARLQPFWTQLYDAAEIPLVWDVARSRFAKSRNRVAGRDVAIRSDGMRRRPRSPRRAIMEPLGTLRLLPASQGRRLVDVAMASLAVRDRETYHFNYANPREVYLADVGRGVAVAVFGLLPEHRFALECTMGYLALANGVPIGYGGASALFQQLNTGINVFAEFRHSEAAFLWTQIMRVYHVLTGCTRFVANTYQFGGDNSEALKSGAFWFYYRLGYRPVDAEIRRLARAEAARARREPGYRSNAATLRRLAGGDMHLTLPGSRVAEYFDERWFDTLSALATAALVDSGATHRDNAARQVADRVARDIGLRAWRRWPSAERRGFELIAPLVAAARPADWPPEDRVALRALLRAKGAPHEAPFARLLAGHARLRDTLKTACRRIDP